MLSAEPNQRHEVLKGIGSERSNNLNQTKYGGENEATEDDIYEFTGRNSEWWITRGRWDGWIGGSLRPPAAAASRLVSSRPAPPLCSSVVLHIRGGCPPSISQARRSQSLNGPWAVTLEILRGPFFMAACLVGFRGFLFSCHDYIFQIPKNCMILLLRVMQ